MTYKPKCFPERPEPWAYRRSTADRLCELQRHMLVPDSVACIALQSLTHEFYLEFGCAEVTVREILERVATEGPWKSFLAADFGELAHAMGCQADAALMSGMLEMYKGVIREGLVLTRTNDTVPGWSVVVLPEADDRELTDLLDRIDGGPGKKAKPRNSKDSPHKRRHRQRRSATAPA